MTRIINGFLCDLVETSPREFEWLPVISVEENDRIQAELKEAGPMGEDELPF